MRNHLNVPDDFCIKGSSAKSKAVREHPCLVPHCNSDGIDLHAPVNTVAVGVQCKG